MSIILNDGTVLPDLSADVLAEHPYAILGYAANSGVYAGLISTAPFFYDPVDNLYVSLGTGYLETMFIQAEASWYTSAEQEDECVWPEYSFDIMWSNHDVYEVTGADENGNPIFGTEIYFKSSIFRLPDGTELPALPDGCFDGTPYGLIVKTTDVYAFYSAERAMYVSPFEENGHNYLVAPSGFVRLFGIVNEQWMEQPGGELPEDYPLYDIASVVCAWSNHDLLTATAKNDDGSYTIGSEIARKSDVNYRVTGGWMTSIANEARRLGVSTDSLKPADIETILRAVTTP